MADIQSFLTFTSSQNEDVARQYLEMAGGNLETAVGLYMEMGGENGLVGGTGVGMDNEFGMNAAAAASAGGGNNNFAYSSAVAVGPDGLDPSLDAATRAAILAAQGPPGPSPIRAPDQTRTMRLVGGDSPFGGGGSAHAALLSAVAGPHAAAAAMMDDDLNAMGSATWGMNVRDNINREAERRMARGRNSGSSNEDAVDVDESDDDLEDEDAAGRANAGRGSTNAAPSLSTMFSPPTHLMHRGGGFQGARNVAKDARRWLLVNVQSDGDFACHALNRDVWRDELVENLVREGFIFWQVMSTNPEGQTYITRYKVAGYPHLAIIDPRTGSLLWKKEGWTQVDPLTAEQFVEIASDFCSRHSFSKQPAPAKHRYTNSGSSQPSNKRPIQELSEEEQLQAAIRASMMTENGDDNTNEEEDVLDKSMEFVDNNDEAESEEKPAALNEFEQEILALDVGDEPDSGDVARIQIRMPDGKRLVRKFKADDTVKIIYAFVAQSNVEAREGKVFELKAKFPPQDLLPSVNESISSCGLNGEAINVMWK
ncbi:hypothetical protein ACHAXN_005806 [Cyclotella atomus]